MNVVTVPKAQMHNLYLCFSRCHLEILGVVAAGYASGLHIIDDGDGAENQIVVDIGGGTTTISFFYNGIFCGSEVVQLGGKSITSDVAYGLNISIANAERLKTLHGAAFCSISDEYDMIFVPVIEDNDVINLQRIPKSSLNQLIQPRVDEIFTVIKQKIESSAFGADFSKSIWLTGGGSSLSGIRDYASRVLNKKIKLKNMRNSIDGSDVQIDNDFSVAFGIIDFLRINDKKNSKMSFCYNNNGFIKKALSWFEKYL